MIRAFANAMVWFLTLLLNVAGIDLTLTDAPVSPEGATDLGDTDVVQVGVVVLAITSGTGPALHTYFTGYWTASGN